MAPRLKRPDAVAATASPAVASTMGAREPDASMASTITTTATMPRTRSHRSSRGSISIPATMSRLTSR